MTGFGSSRHKFPTTQIYISPDFWAHTLLCNLSCALWEMLRCFLNPLHECIRQTGRHLPKANSARPAAYRGFRTTPSCNRDLFAKYRRADDPSSSAGKDSATFQTVSTVPAGSSFQDVPAPLTDKNEVKSRMAIPLPAMASLDETRSKPVQARGREEIVQGVVVPAKPRPPTEEGKCSTRHRLDHKTWDARPEGRSGEGIY